MVTLLDPNFNTVVVVIDGILIGVEAGFCGKEEFFLAIKEKRERKKKKKEEGKKKRTYYIFCIFSIISLRSSLLLSNSSFNIFPSQYLIILF